MNKYILLILISFFTGCATSSDYLTQLKPGMTENEIYEVMGPAKSIDFQNGRKYFRYELPSGIFEYPDNYVIETEEGILVSYGPYRKYYRPNPRAVEAAALILMQRHQSSMQQNTKIPPPPPSPQELRIYESNDADGDGIYGEEAYRIGQ